MPRMLLKANLPTKPCARRGRLLTWWEAWAREWESVK